MINIALITGIKRVLAHHCIGECNQGSLKTEALLRLNEELSDDG